VAGAVASSGQHHAARRRPPLWLAVALILLVALGVRLLYVDWAPVDALVHDARDYDRHATSIAKGDGYPFARAPGRETAFRPPGYPYLLAGVYKLAGVETAETPERLVVARRLGVIVGTLIVALIGVVAAQLWGRRVSLVAMALAAVHVPLVLVGGAVMSEALFALLVLAALAAAIQHRRSPHRWRWAVAAGVLAGLTILTRANAIVLLLPLVLAVWLGRPRLSWRALGPPAVLVAMALLTVSPWTIRNAVVFDRFVPVSTQFGSALAGTYNDEARTDEENPASWRAIKHLDDYRPLYARLNRTSEPAFEDELRARAREYIAEHPTYVAEVGFWSTARMLELTGKRWWRHTASTIAVEPEWADRGVYAFWIVAVLALVGAFTTRARRTPRFVWAFPVLLYLSVAFLVVETPRYRVGIDVFLVLLAALALTMKTSSRRGPWTPSTRSSSMSDVADGPETSVIGRPAEAAPARRATASGTDATI
jgi:4-amino-4-deoxy-L-arabinose transferase-like glycosyltransferase